MPIILNLGNFTSLMWMHFSSITDDKTKQPINSILCVEAYISGLHPYEKTPLMIFELVFEYFNLTQSNNFGLTHNSIYVSMVYKSTIFPHPFKHFN